jgi:hypothetical protein
MKGMRMKLRRLLASFVLFTLVSSAIAAEEHAVAPYVDPSQLDVPFGKHSDYRQPWRAFLETRNGAEFLRGIGANYNAHDNDELAMRLLAEMGVRTLRIEFGWGGVNWDESGFSNQKRYQKILELCASHHIRPTILLNANQGVPCPIRFFTRKLAADAPAGATSIRLADTADLVVGRSGLNNLSPRSYWACEALITSVNKETGECHLSKSLPVALSKDKAVSMATLKYCPFYPVGKPEFRETADGWVRYAMLACDLAAKAGIEEFDIELWNELSFGSRFTEINHYYSPPLFDRVPNFLLEGGSSWELSAETVKAVKAKYPRVRVIWGWSNTTFFHTPVDKLPPGVDGQSYHPYGTGTHTLPDEEIHKDHPEENIDGFVPKVILRMSEGRAELFLQTECLMRLLNPKARRNHPPQTERFYQYMTEHGVAPPECGVTAAKDEAAAWRIKTLCAVRSYCLWLNKGVDVMHYYCAWEKDVDGMGLLPPDLKTLPADAKFDDVATPPMKAIRNLTRAFAGATAIADSDRKSLGVEVTELEGGRKTFEGDAKHPPLFERESFAFLPWQINKSTFVIAAYVMTYDVTKPIPVTRYRLTINNLPALVSEIKAYDPLADEAVAVTVVHRGKDDLTIELPVVDYPRLLTLSTVPNAAP